MQRLLVTSLNLLFIVVCRVHNHSYTSNEASKEEKQRYPPIQSLITNGIFAIHPRPFYVRLVYMPQLEFFCGGAIIDRLWVVTAAHCMESVRRSHRVNRWKSNNLLTSDVAVEVGDFSRYTAVGINDKQYHRVATWYTVPGYQYSLKPINNIAILRLADPIEDRWRWIPLCGRRFYIGTEIATCGMGAKNGSAPVFPLRLQEAYFVETNQITLTCEGFPVRYLPPREPVVPCPDDIICTKSVLSASNICHKDEGSPLYVVNFCSDFQLSAFGGPGMSMIGKAECLYGVASYYQSKSTSTCNSNSTGEAEVRHRPQLEENCNDGSFFARVQPHVSWIHRMIMLNS